SEGALTVGVATTRTARLHVVLSRPENGLTNRALPQPCRLASNQRCKQCVFSCDELALGIYFYFNLDSRPAPSARPCVSLIVAYLPFVGELNQVCIIEKGIVEECASLRRHPGELRQSANLLTQYSKVLVLESLICPFRPFAASG